MKHGKYHIFTIGEILDEVLEDAKPLLEDNKQVMIKRTGKHPYQYELYVEEK